MSCRTQEAVPIYSTRYSILQAECEDHDWKYL